MIVFSFTLTPNQISVLKSVRDYADGGGNAPDIHATDSCPRLYPPEIRNTIAGSSLLFREKFIVHYKRDNPPFGKPGHYKHRTVGKDVVDVWEVTEKGRLMLRLIELEIEDQRRALGPIASTTPKRLRSGAA